MRPASLSTHRASLPVVDPPSTPNRHSTGDRTAPRRGTTAVAARVHSSPSSKFKTPPSSALYSTVLPHRARSPPSPRHSCARTSRVMPRLWDFLLCTSTTRSARRRRAPARYLAISFPPVPAPATICHTRRPKLILSPSTSRFARREEPYLCASSRDPASRVPEVKQMRITTARDAGLEMIWTDRRASSLLPGISPPAHVDSTNGPNCADVTLGLTAGPPPTFRAHVALILLLSLSL
ncbi:hypothetical protein DFH09DRAFT_1309508 [Mycena vulgaris]|nr:hypothetical protein DFH09DRAFT_1309508 [Mycena vulgaris]